MGELFVTRFEVFALVAKYQIKSRRGDDVCVHCVVLLYKIL